MVPTASLKYVLFFCCTFAFNLLSTPVCALSIGAETTIGAISVGLINDSASIIEIWQVLWIFV
ncbi:hypothetical protein AAZX31_09G104500 [Glycine max]|nr:hypothetical protein GYH30_024718 [Glycine max]